MAENRYLQHNLVSDLPGLADHRDPNMVNPWGIASSPKSPFWVMNNGSRTATVYSSGGEISPLVVPIPGPAGAASSAPTGQVFNSTTSFVLQGDKPALFLFCGEDGTISGWNSSLSGNEAVIAVDNSGSAAVYKGLALGNPESGPVLYAADFHAGRVDSFGGDFARRTLAGAFADPSLPAGFAPFNVYVANGKVFVAYAKQDDDRRDDIPGNGNGYVNVFDLDGRLLQRLISGGHLSSPWGMTMAPDGFGDFSKALLVGNFGDGTINAYNAGTGDFLGTLTDADAKPIVNLGLWALQFGNGASGGDGTALYFTAGISGPDGDAIESHGLFGSIQAAPILTTEGVVSAAGFQKGIAPNAWTSIFGKNLSATTRSWQASDFVDNRLPTELDGVSVTIDGKPAYISYISPTQVNVLAPANLPIASVAVQTKNHGLAATPASVDSTTVLPAFFQFGKYALATHADGKSLVGPVDLAPGAAPAKAGDVIVLYGTGFGATDPPVVEGTVVTSVSSLLTAANISMGGAPADIQFAGLTGTGLYQFNVRVPAGLAAGDALVLAESGGTRSPEHVLTSIDAPTDPPPQSNAQIDNFQFTPDPVNMSPGGTLIWTNKQGVSHTVVSDAGAFKSQVLGQDQTFSVVLAAPGTYTYHCSIHPFMKGKVVVQ